MVRGLMGRLGTLAKDTWLRWGEHGDLLAAAIAFYTLLSVPPLLVIAVALVGLVFDPADARGVLFSRLSAATGPELANTVMQLVSAAEAGRDNLAAIFAALVLLWAASRVFLQIQHALNLMWGVQVTAQQSALQVLRTLAYKRVVSFAMVLACGAFLLATLVLQTVLVAIGDAALRLIATVMDTRAASVAVLMAEQIVIAFVVLSALFALLFRVLPDAKIHWSDVWAGAALTAALVLCGTWLLGFYLSSIAPAWLSGTIGSVAAFMLWTYYLAQVFLLGAAFTRAWSIRLGDVIEPAPYAEFSRPPEPPR